MFYAQLNKDNICIGISELAGEPNDSSLIPLEAFDESYIWKKYEDGQWSIEQHIPGTVVLHQDEIALLLSSVSQQEAIIRTVTQTRLEQLEQQNLILMDALAATFEEILSFRALMEGGTA
ncbi:hypothetical protein [Syntrophomonas curvata]